MVGGVSNAVFPLRMGICGLCELLGLNSRETLALDGLEESSSVMGDGGRRQARQRAGTATGIANRAARAEAG